MRGVQVIYTANGDASPGDTLQGALGPIQLANGPADVLGIFVHQGAHYTAIISRAGVLYHIDSLPVASGDGQYIYEVSAELFLQFVQHFAQASRSPTPGRPVIGGMVRIFYIGSAVH